MVPTRDGGGRVDACPARRILATRGNPTCSLRLRRRAEQPRPAAKPIMTRLHTSIWVYSQIHRRILARCG